MLKEREEIQYRAAFKGQHSALQLNFILIVCHCLLHRVRKMSRKKNIYSYVNFLKITQCNS